MDRLNFPVLSNVFSRQQFLLVADNSNKGCSINGRVIIADINFATSLKTPGKGKAGNYGCKDMEMDSLKPGYRVKVFIDIF